jgi:type IV pilus biogenesis protein CpaD/CtpE
MNLSKVGVIGSLTAVLASSLLACTRTDPCGTIGPPSAVELSASDSGADIERDVYGGECELVDGRWIFDTDTTHHNNHNTFGSSTKSKTPAPKASPKSTSAPKQLSPPKTTTKK